MYELNRTHARWAFKDLLGQANHFLITILVGLNGVRNGSTELEEEFRTSWNPKSVERSADRSRTFVLDLALIRAVDALDTYLMLSARKPCALADMEFRSKMDGTGQSVAGRLDVFDKQLSPLQKHHKAILSVAIEWRNKRVHSLAEVRIHRKTINQILDQADIFRDKYNGLDAKKFLTHYKDGEAPTFKETAAIIRLTHEAVSHYDNLLLKHLPVEEYLKAALLQLLEHGNAVTSNSIGKTWNHTKREQKVIRLLRMVGVNETEQINGRRIPDEFIVKLTSLKSSEVFDFLNP